MKLIVYTSKKCPKYKALKKWLRRNNLSFTEKSLDDTDVMVELVMVNIAVFSAPLLSINGFLFQFAGDLEGNF